MKHILTKKPAVFLALSIVLSGLTSGLSFAHVLEIPGKHQLDFVEFIHVHHGFYGGYAVFGGVAWIFCLMTGLVYGFIFRNKIPRVSLLCFIAGLIFFTCLSMYFFFLLPYNSQIADWDRVEIQGWQRVRNNWELCHSIIFVFSTIAFLLFLKAGFQHQKYHHLNASIGAYSATPNNG